MTEARSGGWLGALAGAGATLYGAGWEMRRAAYARGWKRPVRVGARVVSIGNLTVGGTGKTTLALHLVRTAIGRGLKTAVVARDYRPGPDGRADEALLYERAFGREPVFAGASKARLAARAASLGFPLVVVDDGFSTWGLARDLDVVLLDRRDLWGGAALLPAGRLREPRRALQRADVVAVSRLAAGEDPSPYLAEARRYAPGAWLAAGRHRITGLRGLDGSAVLAAGRVRVVTATGNAEAVAASAREAGLEVEALSAYRDHHWFTPGEAGRELERARRDGTLLLLTAKDAVRWPSAAWDPRVAVLEVEWEWVHGGEEVERRVFEGGS
jgi:tetraacyldisaccharide 4'-kinase